MPEIAVSLTAVRIGALDLLLILGLDDVWYREGPLLADIASSHGVAAFAIVVMNGLFLTGLTYRVMTKRFAVAWDTAAIAGVYVAAVIMGYAVNVSAR